MRLLVVEDEVRLAAALERGLRAEGFSVDVAAAATSACGRPASSATAPSSSTSAPGRNGYRVCRELREGGDDTPILMLTAKQGAYDEAEALDTGADDFLSKPFAFVVLVARLRALVRRAGAHGRWSQRRPAPRSHDPALHPGRPGSC